MSLHDYRNRLRGAVASSAAPYGYTLTIWTSGAIAAHERGVPATLHALLLAAGAIAAFALVGVLAFGRPGHALRAPEERVVEVWGAFHLPVVAAAVGLATLVAKGVHDASVAWLAVGFLSTAAYLLLIALQYMIAEQRSMRRLAAELRGATVDEPRD